MKIEMFGNRVLVLVQHEPKQSSIVQPESAMRAEVLKGTVVSVGPGKLSANGTALKAPVELGQQVWFSNAIQRGELKIDGQLYVMVDGDDLLGVEDANAH